MAATLVGSQTAIGGPIGLLTVAEARPATPAQPNRFDPKSAASSVLHRPQPGKAGTVPGSGSQPYSAPRQLSVPMQPAMVAVDPASGAHLVGSDGVLEVDVPAGAVTAADVRGAGGSLSLLARQVLPPSGSSAGGSGHYSFGTYLVQLVDAAGRPAAQAARKPLTFRLHHDRRAQALDLRHTRVLVNPSLPGWFDPSPPAVLPAPAAGGSPRPSSPATAARASSPATGARAASPATGGRSAPVQLGPQSHQTASWDAAAGTLSAVVPATGQATAVSFDTNSPVAVFGKPDPFTVGLSGGALTAGYPIDVPAGPGGFTPPVNLAYSSAGVAEQHNPQGAAPWVGEGWNLSFGAISWSEHQVFSTCGACTPQWEDSWQLSDPFGSGADLLPPNINVSTYNDDSGNGHVLRAGGPGRESPGRAGCAVSHHRHSRDRYGPCVSARGA